MSFALARLAIVGLMFVAVGLAGCTATETDVAEMPEAVVTSQVTPVPTRPMPARPTFGLETLSNGAAPDRCREDGYAVDSGPAPMADGTVETDAQGKPVAYIVAQGDAPQAIEKRLCITNLMERNGLNRYIQPGERLTIDPKPRIR